MLVGLVCLTACVPDRPPMETRMYGGWNGMDTIDVTFHQDGRFEATNFRCAWCAPERLCTLKYDSETGNPAWTCPVYTQAILIGTWIPVDSFFEISFNKQDSDYTLYGDRHNVELFFDSRCASDSTFLLKNNKVYVASNTEYIPIGDSCQPAYRIKKPLIRIVPHK